MKKALTVTLYSVLVLAVSTIFSARIESPVDGNDTYGFPSTFYIKYGGRCAGCPADRSSLELDGLLLDLIVAAAIGWMIAKLVRRRGSRRRSLLQNWQIPIEPGFRKMDNGDSIQYANDDNSIVLFFSLLVITNDPLLPAGALAKLAPSVTHTEDGWQFKAAKQGGQEVLVCLFSFTNETDEARMKDLFANISWLGK